MSDPLPSFQSPPVVETALSVQFRPLTKFTNAHLGLFWSGIRNDYPDLRDAEPIEPQSERFGDHPFTRFRQIRISAAEPGSRLQMADSNGHMMVQLQNGRLAYNWRKLQDGVYPRWHSVKPQFNQMYAHLKTFLQEENLGDMEPNQWEVTYVNHLVKGREWEEASDLPQLLPGLMGPSHSFEAGELETLSARCNLLLPDKRGRLHIDLSHGFVGSEEDAQEVFVLKLTCRGGIDQNLEFTLDDGLAEGRAAIVRTFTEMTSQEAHTLWGRNQ